MSALREEVKRRIVVELASFRSTLEVAAILQEEYDLEVRPGDLCRYDATKEYFVGGAALAELFDATRRTFVTEIASVPLANAAYRLHRLERLLDAAELKGDLKLAAALIEQAAKEVGHQYTNPRVKPETAPRRPPMSASEARARIATTLGKRGLRLLTDDERAEQAQGKAPDQAAVAAELQRLRAQAPPPPPDAAPPNRDTPPG